MARIIPSDRFTFACHLVTITPLYLTLTVSVTLLTEM